jgi:disulfide oxidoreductase YuzD
MESIKYELFKMQKILRYRNNNNKKKHEHINQILNSLFADELFYNVLNMCEKIIQKIKSLRSN